MTGTRTAVAGSWKEIAASFFKLGATSYGGPAIMGIMQVELQEKRRWVSKERFLEGLAVANMLPGATATQLGIFLGYARGGWAGGLLGGVCFVLPAFVIMLGLTIAYAGFSVTPVARGALYGLGPVVLGLYAVAVYRLGRAAATTVSEMVIGMLAAAAAIGTSLGVVVILVLAGIAGWVLLQPARPRALWVTFSCVLFAAILTAAWWLPRLPRSRSWMRAGPSTDTPSPSSPASRRLFARSIVNARPPVSSVMSLNNCGPSRSSTAEAYRS